MVWKTIVKNTSESKMNDCIFLNKNKQTKENVKGEVGPECYSASKMGNNKKFEKHCHKHMQKAYCWQI